MLTAGQQHINGYPKVRDMNINYRIIEIDHGQLTRLLTGYEQVYAQFILIFKNGTIDTRVALSVRDKNGNVMFPIILNLQNS